MGCCGTKQDKADQQQQLQSKYFNNEEYCVAYVRKKHLEGMFERISNKSQAQDPQIVDKIMTQIDSEIDLGVLLKQYKRRKSRKQHLMTMSTIHAANSNSSSSDRKLTSSSHKKKVSISASQRDNQPPCEKADQAIQTDKDHQNEIIHILFQPAIQANNGEDAILIMHSTEETQHFLNSEQVKLKQKQKSHTKQESFAHSGTKEAKIVATQAISKEKMRNYRKVSSHIMNQYQQDHQQQDNNQGAHVFSYRNISNRHHMFKNNVNNGLYNSQFERTSSPPKKRQLNESFQSDDSQFFNNMQYMHGHELYQQNSGGYNSMFGGMIGGNGRSQFKYGNHYQQQQHQQQYVGSNNNNNNNNEKSLRSNSYDKQLSFNFNHL